MNSTGFKPGIVISFLLCLIAGLTQFAFAQPFVATPIWEPTDVKDCSVSWGDYDGDNDLDLAVAGSANNGMRSLRISTQPLPG